MTIPADRQNRAFDFFRFIILRPGSAARHTQPRKAIGRSVNSACVNVSKPVNLSRFDRLAVISSASLLLANVAGCAASRYQTTTAENLPQDTRFGSTQYRRPAPQINPGPAQDPGYAQEEYPDFRGKRGQNGTGASETEPLRFAPQEDEAGADSVDRRSFRATLHQKVSSLWHRRSSSGAADESTTQAPLAAGAAASGWNVRNDDNLVARGETGNSLPEEGAISDSGLVNLDAPLEKQRVRQPARMQQPQERRTAARRIPLGDQQGALPAQIALDNSSPGSWPGRGTSEQPPEWSTRRLNGPQGAVLASCRPFGKRF